MPHWHEKHDLRFLFNKIVGAQKAKSRADREKLLREALGLVDELLKRRGATRRFNRNKAGAMKAIKRAVKLQPECYTSRQLVSEFKDEFGKDTVLAAIADLKEKGSITMVRKDAGKGAKGQYAVRPQP